MNTSSLIYPMFAMVLLTGSTLMVYCMLFLGGAPQAFVYFQF